MIWEVAIQKVEQDADMNIKRVVDRHFEEVKLKNFKVVTGV